MSTIKEIRERHKLVQEVCPPSSGGLKSAGELAHNDRATLLKKVGELEAKLDAVRDAYPDLIGIEIALQGEKE